MPKEDSVFLFWTICLLFVQTNKTQPALETPHTQTLPLKTGSESQWLV